MQKQHIYPTICSMVELERRNEQGDKMVRELESQELHVIDATSLQDAIKSCQTERWEDSSTSSNPNIRKF